MEKYEKLRALESEAAGSNCSLDDDDADTTVDLDSSGFGAVSTPLGFKRQSSQAVFGSAMASLVMIEEEPEQEKYNESLLEHIEKHAGSALDQA